MVCKQYNKKTNDRKMHEKVGKHTSYFVVILFSVRMIRKPKTWCIYTIIEQKFKIIKTYWRCRGSNPVPLACKASALPFELHPHLE